MKAWRPYITFDIFRLLARVFFTMRGIEVRKDASNYAWIEPYLAYFRSRITAGSFVLLEGNERQVHCLRPYSSACELRAISYSRECRPRHTFNWSMARNFYPRPSRGPTSDRGLSARLLSRQIRSELILILGQRAMLSQCNIQTRSRVSGI